jgi:hypothetical protein
MYIGAGLCATQWMPLYILMLLKFIRKPDVKQAVYLAIAGVVVMSTSVHFGFFMGIFTVAFLLARYVYLRLKKGRASDEEGDRVSRTRKVVLALAVALVVLASIVPVFAAFVIKSNQSGKWPTTLDPLYLRSDTFYSANAAKPGEYLLPNVLNPVFGKISQKIIGDVQPNFENAIYVGWIPTLLALVFVLFGWRAYRRRARNPDGDSGDEESSETRGILWGFAAAGASAFILSLPPHFHIGSVSIPMPSKILSIIAPWFRWYNRLSIVVSLCLIVIACFGLKRLLSHMGTLKTLAVIFVLALVTLEMTLVPPVRNFEFEPVPAVFNRVAKLPAEAALTFYPLTVKGAFITSRLTFYQRNFQKPMLNGATPNSDGEALRRTVFNPYDRATPSILKRFGLDYLVFFTGRIEGTEGQAQDVNLLPPGLVEVSRFAGKGVFESGRLYKVTAAPADVVPLYLGNISVPYIDEGGVTVRLLDRTGLIKLENYSGHDRSITLRLPMDNPFTAREVRISGANGRLLWSGRIEARAAAVAEITGLDVPAGGLDLFISVNGRSFTLPYQYVTIFGTTTTSLKIGDVQVVE